MSILRKLAGLADENENNISVANKEKQLKVEDEIDCQKQKHCDQCGSAISESDKFCGGCGEEIIENEKIKMAGTEIIIFVIFLMLGTYFIFIETWLLPVKIIIFIVLVVILKLAIFSKNENK